jgi:hypothetical protein
MMKIKADNLRDLRDWPEVPVAGLRGQRQQGGLALGATMENPHFDDHVIRTVNVGPEVFDRSHPSLSRMDQEYLFPSQEVDAFYRVLLEAKSSTDRGVSDLAKFIIKYMSVPSPV